MENIKIYTEKEIQLANDIVEGFRCEAKETFYDSGLGGPARVYSSRLGLLKTELTFDEAVKVIEKSIKLIRREYKDTFDTISNLGMYFTLKQRKKS